jgi:hypothetical protein
MTQLEFGVLNWSNPAFFWKRLRSVVILKTPYKDQFNVTGRMEMLTFVFIPAEDASFFLSSWMVLLGLEKTSGFI